MKKITIVGAEKVTQAHTLHKLGIDLIIEGDESMSVFDGFHIMDELYDHRITLFIALCKRLEKDDFPVWRSKLHSDGTSFEGWFIFGIEKGTGAQMTYHLPLDRWEETNFAEDLENAPEWDGHSPADVLERLKKL